jgi:hypothetical protein
MIGTRRASAVTKIVEILLPSRALAFLFLPRIRQHRQGYWRSGLAVSGRSLMKKGLELIGIRSVSLARLVRSNAHSSNPFRLQATRLYRSLLGALTGAWTKLRIH